MKRTLHLILYLLISLHLHSQSNFNIWRTEALDFIQKNDANSAIISLNKIIKQFKSTPNSVIDIYLQRAKLYTVTSQYDLAENDINTYLSYDSACTEAYLSKLILIENQQKKIELLNAGLQQLPNDFELLIQKCIVKIGIISNYWEMQNNLGIGYNKNQANKEIPTAKNGCAELFQLANNTNEVHQLYKKICKIPDIKSF